ncbi:MAG: O-antigen ligase family protein [Planctomycetota bacterium]
MVPVREALDKRLDCSREPAANAKNVQSLVVLTACLLLWLQPVQCLKLPGNLQLADFASLVFMPLCWSWLVRTRRPLRLPLLSPMLGILCVTGIAAVASRDPMSGAIVLVTESYLYLWFVTLALLFGSVDEAALRRLLWVWVLSGLANGALILMQFVHPPLLATMNGMLSGRGALDPFRPSGLFENCNSASLFQLSVFVPLLALRLRERTTAALAAVLLAMMLGTGSMGGALAFATGTAVMMLLLVVLRQQPRAFLRYIALGLVGLVLLMILVALLVALVPSIEHRIEYVLTGRGEGSANSRFGLWQKGIDILLRDLPAFGVGPDVFKSIAGFGMHNDILSFAVERGLLGVLFLILLVVMAAVHAVQLGRDRHSGNGALVHAGILCGLVAIAQTHEIFHQRPLWVMLALQEGLWWRMLRRRVAEASVARLEPEVSPVESGELASH